MSPKVLIVDDDAIVASDIERCVLSLGYAVAGVAHAPEMALETALRTRPDVALMDVNLGSHTDGIEVARQIRSRLQTPIVFLTAYADAATLTRAEKAQPHGFVPKPFDDRDLRSAIELAIHRNESEKALRKSEERYRQLFHNDVAGNFELDVARLEVTEWNVAFARIFGIPQLDGPAIDARTLFPGGTALEALLERIRTEGRLVNEEIELRREDAGALYVLANVGGVFSDEGELIRVVGHVTDMTEQRMLRAQLVRAHRLEAIGRLAGGIAHDFNNLLAGVSGHAELVLAEGELKDQGRRDVEQILRGTARARELVRQLLAVSRRQVMHPRPIDLNVIAREMVALFERTVGDAIRIRTRLMPGGAWVLADPAQIEQVLLNLVVNARDAMPEGGELVVRTARGSAAPNGSPLDGEEHILLSVEDSGPGIPEDVIEDIFDPFFTTKDEGTGLGLATVYGIVAQSGGGISVQSLRGAGATFTVHLPETAPASAVETPAPVAPVKHGRGRVLVVDDNDAVRSIAMRMLAGAGYEVTSAADGRSALELAQGMIDVVLTDLDMPGLSGSELVRRLAETRPELPIVVMSGYLAEPDALPPGTRYLEKPFSRDRLVGIIAEALGEERDVTRGSQ